MSRQAKGGDDNRRSRRWERGSTIPLYIGFTVVILGALGLVVDSAQLFVAQRKLSAIADGASLAAADAVDVESLYEHGVGGRQVTLSQDLAEIAVQQYVSRLKSTGVGRLEQNMNCNQVDVDPAAGRVTVGCDSQVDLPFVHAVTIDLAPTWTVSADASAEALIP